MKKVEILIFTMLYFFIKIKKNSWRYHYFPPVCQKSWLYDLQLARYSTWWIEIGYFGSFFMLLPTNAHPHPHKKLKNQNLFFKKWRYRYFTHVPKIRIIWWTVLEIQIETDIIFLSYWVIFCTFTSRFPLIIQKI